MTRVLFLCCHLAGTGHLVRTLGLARAVAAAGGLPLVVSGGRALPHIDAAGVTLVQIPPLTVQGLDFSTPLMPCGAPADDAWLARRRAEIEGAVRAFRPEALVTELFPLGRRRLAPEFEAAIRAAREANPGVAVIASVRDVPEPPSRPEQLAEAADRLGAHYDRLIVHGEAEFLPLSESWPLPDRLAPMTRHTGYVAEPPPTGGGRTPGDEILVSVGGGDRGRALLDLAARAAALSSRRWRLLVGGTDASRVAAGLAARHAAANLVIEPVRPDYRRLLARAACSVSLCGYNTVMDLAPLSTPAILVPDESAGQREQAIRAGALARFDGFERLAPDAAPALLAETAEAMASRRRAPLPLALDGAARAATVILAAAHEKARA